MPSVSEITQRLIDIVQANVDLQDVWIRGKISNIKHIRNAPFNFTLTDKGEKIECVIFDNLATLRENLPSEGNSVFVKGQIFVYGVRSEYRFKVTDINLSKNPSSDQSISINALTEILENTILDHSGEVQGQIADIYYANTGWTNFKLKTVTADEAPDNIIECSLPPSIANNVTFPLAEGEEISVKGRFQIFSARNAYQIVINNTIDIERVPDSLAETSTSRCNVCGQHHDTGYQLCPMCHYAQVEHEGIVVGAVERYFGNFNNFSIQREYPILLIGTIRGRADVALLDSNENLTAIAECKRIRYDGNDGIDQLKSYLFPSETKLGLFADDTDPQKWIFLKNLGRREFAQITRSEFEALVVDQETPPLHQQPNQNSTSPTIPENPTSRFWQYITGVFGVALCICLTVLIMQLNEKNRQIQDNTKAISQLENKNETLANENQTLEKQIRNGPQTISQLQNENKTLESENQNLQEQITEKDIQIQNNTSTILKLESENETITSKNDELRKQLTKNESDIVDLRKRIDEMQTIIDSYSILPRPPSENPEPPPSKPVSSILNINTASIEELDKLPGIGPSNAKSIIEYREKHGKFASVDDITKISGIGEKTLENLRQFIRAE